MKGNQTVLTKTEITTTYDENNQKITEVKEDYENNKITITIPEYYLFGYTEKPGEMPQNLTQNTSYTIKVYTTHYASIETTHKQVKLINMPFNLTFYHQDHLGTTRYITNDSGEILHTTDTLAYGEELTAPFENDKDEVLNTITYTGHEKNYETDLTYMLARYYSGQQGIFLSPDKFDLLGKINSLSANTNDPEKLKQLENLLANPLYWNKYTYCLDNPVNRVDKDGKFSVVFIVAVAVGAGVGIYYLEKWMDSTLTQAKKERYKQKYLMDSGHLRAAIKNYYSFNKSVYRSLPDVVKKVVPMIFSAIPQLPSGDWEVIKIMNKIGKNKIKNIAIKTALEEAIDHDLKKIERQLQDPNLSQKEKEKLIHIQKRLKLIKESL
ncbi:hypothetical protein TTHT_2006 [Thermotomaculum hydrothermale]|uniref:Uncharacterized protein n=1 Tax=Thermotomaculum hydrothermale TaxID=981385 RepID=A0A7R6Q0R3_9BACT|nr:RHS repeat-associated core domain-containing protein [Thermotomaculum hydrothermale]BBB33448.1 hypothetical protein TTHT_2006 [Thermotomaculum hydrothermale]